MFRKKSKILIKLTKECRFSDIGKFVKQTDGCSLGRPIYVVVGDKHKFPKWNLML